MSSEQLVLASWNVNSLRKRSVLVAEWLETNSPDVVCFQETKVVDSLFPVGLFDECGYKVAFHGQKAYNGVAIASRHTLTDVKAGLPGMADGQARLLAATVRGVRVLSVYVPNGAAPGTDKYAHKLEFYDRLREYLVLLRNQCDVVVAGGDYNVAPTDADVYDIDDYGRNTIACSAPERAAYARVLTAGYVDAHRHIGGCDHAHTWWDYRSGSYRNDRGLRIDHFLVSGGVCTKVMVDHGPRQASVPSDHAPVILQLDI